MPRLSLYRENHSNDYRFQDRRISELFTISGVGINVHKFLGAAQQINTNDATQPTYLNQSEKNIQDLLFLENRDRTYDKSVYNLRGHYTIQDNDFNLSQFGLFMTNDTVYITLHINDMIERIGRKIISGDVFEMPHLKDYWPLDDSIPVALKKFYVVQETTRAAEGFAPTWWPHLWRCKCVPMVDGQEYREILDADADDTGLNPSADGSKVRDGISAYVQNIAINEAIVLQAEASVPKSGYSTANLWVLPSNANITGSGSSVTADNTYYTSDLIKLTVDQDYDNPAFAISGYLVGDGTAPNNASVLPSTTFPSNPYNGQYVLRLDYLPHRLFRFDGFRWVAIQDAVRQAMTGTKNTSLMGSFVNNTNKTHVRNNGTIDERQTLNSLFTTITQAQGPR
jgi:hypothetical protein